VITRPFKAPSSSKGLECTITTESSHEIILLEHRNIPFYEENKNLEEFQQLIK
jgi:hypothetical protein